MQNRSKTLRWGLLSTARINQALFVPLRKSKRSELYGVASREIKKAAEYACEQGIPRAYGSYQELLDDPQIDVVYNPLPNHLHAEWTIRALEAGKHVLLEKPFALTVAEVRAVRDAAKRTGKVVAEAFMYRHHPQTRRVQELVREGALGELLVMHGSFTFTLNKPDDFRWQPEYGGGSIWDVGCYPISYMRMLAGAVPLSVLGSQVNTASGVDLTFLGQMTYPGGLMGQFSCSFGLPYLTHMEIRGTQGRLPIPFPFSPHKNCPPAVLCRGEVAEKLKVPPANLYLGEVEDMERAVLDGAAPLLSLQESQDNIATILALLESARSGRAVKL
jgi:xylose dehydrogenase (NAD/NADP)